MQNDEWQKSASNIGQNAVTLTEILYDLDWKYRPTAYVVSTDDATSPTATRSFTELKTESFYEEATFTGWVDLVT